MAKRLGMDDVRKKWGWTLIVFFSLVNGPAAESRWPRLAMSGAHRKMFLANRSCGDVGFPFYFYSEQKSLRFDAVTCHHWL